MKSSLKIAILTLTIGLFTADYVIGQTSVTGRVFAEVVESVSVKSQAVTNFELSNSPELDSDIYIEDANNYTNVNLGEIKISSGSNVGLNLIISPTTLSNTSGDNFNIIPAPTKPTNNGCVLTNGNQTIKLKGSATLNQMQASGNYQGTYSIILAYN